MMRRLSGLPCALVLMLACGPSSQGSDCDDADAPPTAGAACAKDGLVCDPGADMCIEHAALACKDGRWSEHVVAATECETGTPTTGASTGASDATGTTGADAVPCGAAVPAEGSPCVNDGETCAPGASECEPYIEAVCTGTWQHFEVGPGDPKVCEPVACDPQDLPPQGSKCETEGEFCSPGCVDPCSFCNIVKCEGGTWQGLEVFPAECLGCDEICAFVVPAGCAKGPGDLADCVAGCQESDAGDCQIPFHQTLACAGAQPTFGCDAMGRPSVAGCETQFDNFYMCSGL